MEFMSDAESERLTNYTERLLAEMEADPRMEVRDALNRMAGYAFRCGVMYCEELARAAGVTE